MAINSRYYGLDLSRAIFMLLGLVYHASMIFRVDREWRIVNDQQSSIFNLITHILHGFRMDGFYLLSGFFFLLIIEKYGEKKALIDRYVKLGIPMLVVGFSLNTLMNYLSATVDLDPLINYLMQGKWLGHLWFLGNLLVYCTFTVFFTRAFIRRFNNRPPIWLIVFLALAVIPALSVIGTKAPNSIYFFVSIDSLFTYFPFFVFGLYLYAQREIFLHLLTLKNSLLLFLLSGFIFWASSITNLEQISFTLNSLCSKIANTSLALGLIALFNSIGNKPSTTTSTLVDASYSIYLLHMPLLVVYQHLLKGITENIVISFFLLLTSVFISCLFFHLLVIKKSTLLTLLLNGKLPHTHTKPAGTSPSINNPG